MSRGLAWLLGCLLLVPFVIWQLARPPAPLAPLPVLYTLGGDFTLDSTLGARLSLSDLQGEVVLLNFGFTGCPDVCPTTLARMRDVRALLGNSAQRVRPVFVTLDPEVDTLDRMGPYVRHFDPAFIGLTGSSAAIAAAAAPYQVFYEKVFFDEEQVDAESVYTISHSSHIYLIDPAGQVRATFGEGVPVEAIAGAVQRLFYETDALARSNTP